MQNGDFPNLILSITLEFLSIIPVFLDENDARAREKNFMASKISAKSEKIYKVHEKHICQLSFRGRPKDFL